MKTEIQYTHLLVYHIYGLAFDPAFYTEYKVEIENKNKILIVRDKKGYLYEYKIKYNNIPKLTKVSKKFVLDGQILVCTIYNSHIYSLLNISLPIYKFLLNRAAKRNKCKLLNEEWRKSNIKEVKYQKILELGMGILDIREIYENQGELKIVTREFQYIFSFDTNLTLLTRTMLVKKARKINISFYHKADYYTRYEYNFK